MAAAAGSKTAATETNTLAEKKNQDDAGAKAVGSPAATAEDVPALRKQQSTVMKRTQQAGVGSRAAGPWGNTSKTALPGAHCALKAEMTAKQAQVDACEATSEAGKLAAQRDASKAELNALDDADSQYSVGAVREASDAWMAAANAAKHTESVAKDKAEAAEQAH